MFIMGKYDKTKFKEIMNDFPAARAFEVIRQKSMDYSIDF